MAEKLRSILRRTSWSSVLKAVIFAVAWWALPFWLFVLLALYLYYIPLTGAGKVSAPFWVLLLLSFLQAPNALSALIFGLIFYFILLIKDLLIIDRRSAYEILILVLSYLLVRNFFLKGGGAGFGGWSLFYALLVAWVLAMLFASFVKHFSEVPEDAAPPARQFRRAIGWIAFILMWQLLIAGLFLPLNFLYQSAVVFLLAAAFFDLVSQYVFAELSRTKTLVISMVTFALLTLVLASARWTL
jgi:hypothetical protein